MKKKPVITKPTDPHIIKFDDLYEELTKNWELKAKQLQDRRWRQMKRAMKEDSRYGRNY